MRLGGRSPQQPGGVNPVRESMGCTNREDDLRQQTREAFGWVLLLGGRPQQSRTATEVMQLQREKAARLDGAAAAAARLVADELSELERRNA